MGIKERKEREKEQRKQLILEAAREVIFQKGIENTTMDEIAANAELSKATLYLYFRNKEMIQYDICLEGAKILDERLKKSIRENESAIESIIRIGWEFITFSREEPGYFNLFLFFLNIQMQSLDVEPEKIEAYFLYESPFRTLMDLIKKGMEEGSIRNDLPLINISTSLWSAIMGILMMQQNKMEIYKIFKADPGNILQATFEILLDGIRPVSNRKATG